MMEESDHGVIHSKTILRRSKERDLDHDIDDYEDSRIELKATGHNLTSVLMNPRETMFEEFVDEFEIEQAMPLDFIGYKMGRTSGGTEQLAKISRLPTNAEIGYCFKNVPDVYFRSDFSVKHTDIVHAILAFEDKEDSGKKIVAAPRDDNTSVRPGDEGGSAAMEDDNTVVHSRNIAARVELKEGSGAEEKLTEARLTTYLDLVEVALLRQIMSKSSAFFRALDDIHNLQSMVSRAASRIIHIRRELRGFDNEIVAGPLRIPRLDQRRANEKLLHEKLLYMQRVLQGRKTVRTLLELDDYSGALEVISITRKIYQKHLTGITSMVSIGAQLEAYDDHIIEVMCDRFVNLAVSWTDTTADHIDHSLDEVRNGDDVGEEGLAGLAALRSEYSTTHRHNGVAGQDKDRSEPIQPTGALQEPLGQLLHALLHVHKIRPAMELYSTRLQDSIKLIVRTCLIEYISPNPADMYAGGGAVESDNTANAGPFAQRVRNMTNENFLACLSMCFENLLQSLHRACSIHIFINDAFIDEELSWTERDKSELILSQKKVKERDATGENGHDGSLSVDTIISMNGDVGSVSVSVVADVDGNDHGGGRQHASILSSEESCAHALREADKQWALDFSFTLLSNTCELAQKSINQLLIMRKETNARLHIDQMKFLWEVSQHFVVGIEHLEIGGGKQISTQSLRQGLLAQTKKFLEHTHETYKGKLVNTLDHERWQQSDVSRDRQVALDRLTSGRLFLSQQGVGKGAGNRVSMPVRGAESETSEGAEENGEPGGAGSGAALKKKKDVACISVDGVEYKVVWSVLFLIEVVLTYLEVAVQFPLITRDVISKIVEVSALFDNRSKQLVLGAQAIQSAARLKFIAAKHLGIMAQCLTFLQVVLPHVRAALMTQLPQEHYLSLVELDRVSKGIIEHHSKVLSKFVSIVGDFVDASSLKLRQVDWDRMSAQCEYVEDVIKNVSALHKVLINFLPADQMSDVFSRIFALLNRKIPEHFEEVFPSTQTGKQRIMDEVSHLVTDLARLKHVDTSILTVEETFRKKFERK